MHKPCDNRVLFCYATIERRAGISRLQSRQNVRGEEYFLLVTLTIETRHVSHENDCEANVIRKIRIG